MESFKKYLAELIGTLVLVFLGCGTAALVGTSGAGYILTALAFGFALIALFYSVGNLSGAHLNPAVSLAMLLMRRMSIVDFVGYLSAQLIGSVAGSALIFLLFRSPGLEDRTGAYGANGIAGAGSIWGAVLCEVILTFAFVLTVIGVTGQKEHSNVSGVVCGISLTLVHLFGIGVTGTSVNPARSIGPALFAGGDSLRYLWIFIVAPVIGAILAALLCIFFENGKTREKGKIKKTL